MVGPLAPNPIKRFHDLSLCTCGWATSVRANTICELVSSFSRIHLLPRLETINLTFYPTLGRGHEVDYDSEDSLSLQPSLLAALSKSFSTRVPSKLTSLCLHDLLMSDISPLESPPFQTLLIPTLRCLQLSVIYDIGPDHGRWYNFWNAFFPRTITAPVMHHSLTEFSLHSDMPIGSSSELSFAELFLPNLCTLSLINFVLEPPVGIEPFILRHAATLTRLELLTFGLPVTRLSPLSTSTSPFVTPTGAEESSCSWEDIWDRFAAQLTALIALNIEDCRYCVYGPNRCVWVARVSKSRNAADIAALQRFRTIVALIVAARSGELD